MRVRAATSAKMREFASCLICMGGAAAEAIGAGEAYWPPRRCSCCKYCPKLRVYSRRGILSRCRCGGTSYSMCSTRAMDGREGERQGEREGREEDGGRGGGGFQQLFYKWRNNRCGTSSWCACGAFHQTSSCVGKVVAAAVVAAGVLPSRCSRTTLAE